MKESSAGGSFEADQVLVVALNVWLALVRRPTSSRPPTVNRLPLPSSTTVGYQRAWAMSGWATYWLVSGSNRKLFGEPALALFVAGPGYAELPPATRSSPSGRNEGPAQDASHGVSPAVNASVVGSQMLVLKRPASNSPRLLPEPATRRTLPVWRSATCDVRTGDGEELCRHSPWHALAANAASSANAPNFTPRARPPTE